MPNVKFNYLYRDGANYKNDGFAVFDNATDVCLSDLESLIRSRLYDGAWFYVDQFQLPDLHFTTCDNAIDHAWHEFESIMITNEPADAAMSLPAFIAILTKLPIP